MNSLVISGGEINYDFALDFIKGKSFDMVIAVDRGMEFAYRAGLKVHYVVGDFDSVSEKVLDHYLGDMGAKVNRYLPEKNATDTELGVKKAIAHKSTSIWILGGTGGRADHFLGNLNCLALAEKSGVRGIMVDQWNAIELIKSGYVIHKEQQFGTYVSFLPFGGAVSGVTLEGFRYPLKDALLVCENGLGISNEIVEEEARVWFEKGKLLMIQSRD